MAYVNIDTIHRNFTDISNLNMKMNTFVGILFLLINRTEISNLYIKTNMSLVSNQLNQAFTLKGIPQPRYDEKYWFTLFNPNWIELVKQNLLGGIRVPAEKIALILFWHQSFENTIDLVAAFKQKLNNDTAFDSFFTLGGVSFNFDQSQEPSRSSLYSKFSSSENKNTVSLDSPSFIAKDAGEISAAPFIQTIYSGSSNRKFINLYEFDFLSEYSLQKSKSIPVITHTSTYQPVSIPKSFLLLAGISGTGKSRFVREQAKLNVDDLSNFCLIAVRPDWHEPSDILGYVTRIGIDGSQYVVTPFLKFVVAAFKQCVQSASESNLKYKPLNDTHAYWLCMDEMNLAPVEQYFADYLAVMESRNWDGDDYSCSPLLPPINSLNLNVSNQEKFRKDLDLDSSHDDLWNYFLKNGIAIPPNLIVAGTVNMDETTHGFSRKVIDRAFTIDFGEFYPTDFEEYFTQKVRNHALTFTNLTKVTVDNLSDISADTDGKKSIVFLSEINTILKSTQFELAYRALNELLLSVSCFKPKDEIELCAVWDDFIMTKVLPRIEGDAEKMRATDSTTILDELSIKLSALLSPIWLTQTRPDLLRFNIDNTDRTLECRSKRKIEWMKHKLIDNGFTSYWP